MMNKLCFNELGVSNFCLIIFTYFAIFGTIRNCVCTSNNDKQVLFSIKALLGCTIFFNRKKYFAVQRVTYRVLLRSMQVRMIIKQLTRQWCLI